MVQIGLGDLCHHIVLENCPPERVRYDLGSLTQAEELAEEARVVEVELGAFDHPLVEVPVMGREQKYNKTCL